MNYQSEFKHEMLIANAGSGKTYALTTRIIQLLLAGIKIDKIVALTFTRKSASEFLNELLTRLAQAATNPHKLKELSTATGNHNLSSVSCCHLLRHIIEYFDKIELSTIDSFFARIAQRFSLELGLPEDFAIAENSLLSRAREHTLAKNFNQATKKHGLSAMIEQCRRISRRNGERNVFSTLLNQIDSLQEHYLETPLGCTWGKATSIWNNHPIPFDNAPELREAIEKFERVAKAVNQELSSEALNYLDANLDLLRKLNLEQVWSKDIKSFILSKLCSEPKNGFLQLTRKKTGWLKLTPEIRLARSNLRDALFSGMLHQSLERSQGLYSFVQQFESIYAEHVRGVGLISFADITTLLLERAFDDGTNEAIDWKTQVAYRIDQKFDHWLLDEFQDTSRAQWTILKTFIEEVLMDNSASRSFFYVGDTKQAIYGWRGGDAELFQEIFTYYECIEKTKPLTKSWRSTQPIIEMVNALFGDIENVQSPLNLPVATTKRWKASWNKHKIAPPKNKEIGYSAWHPVVSEPGNDVSPQHIEVLRIIETVKPIARGIECAILMRQNKDVAQLSAYLQSKGIPLAIEGKTNPCTDNYLGCAILTALRAVAHPNDRHSAIIAQGFPCAHAWGLTDINTFRSTTLRSLAEKGFADTLQVWISKAFSLEGESITVSIKTGQNNEDFLKSRVSYLLALAENFDRSLNNEGIDAFIATAEASEEQEAANKEAIRIMTIHQAKGLGFEMVIVSGLDRNIPTRTADELILGPNRLDPKWGIILPIKEIAQADQILGEQCERIEAESKSNELCGAYVALTRAKRALYVVSDQLADNTKSSHFGRHLKICLKDNWSKGDKNWYKIFS